MAKGVSLKEFNDWIKKNEKHTWSIKKMAGWREGSTHLIKYFELSFDTRDMEIWQISCSGMFDEEILIRDSVEDEHKTILDLLNDKIKEILKCTQMK